MGYIENPHNFMDIEHYVITDKNKIAEIMIGSEKCYFYDTCSFRKHVQMPHPEYLFRYFKNTEGVIIITRCILMELASHSGILNAEYVTYMKNMYDAGVTILVLYEEDLFDVLSVCFTTSARINDCLSWAVKTVKTPTSTIASTLNDNKGLSTQILSNRSVSDSTLFQRFFSAVRKNKESDDNLGEELITLCVHLLANIPESCHYKYIVLTEDKGAIGLLKKAVSNADKYKSVKSCTVVTTTKLAQLLFHLEIINQKEQVEEILMVGNGTNRIKFLGSEVYDLETMEKNMTSRELAEKIVIPNSIHIYH